MILLETTGACIVARVSGSLAVSVSVTSRGVGGTERNGGLTALGAAEQAERSVPRDSCGGVSRVAWRSMQIPAKSDVCGSLGDLSI